MSVLVYLSILDNWREDVMKWTEGRGVDIILDCIGGSYFADNLGCLAVDGVWVLYGLMGGADVSGPVLAGKKLSGAVKWILYLCLICCYNPELLLLLLRIVEKERKFEGNNFKIKVRWIQIRVGGQLHQKLSPAL